MDLGIEERVERVLDTLRPALRMDGGNVEFVEFDSESGLVKVRMLGACGGCPMSMMTLKMGIERAVKGKVPEVKSVEAI
jgi:Fe-S cluster biogenesis protein NfuA